MAKRKPQRPPVRTSTTQEAESWPTTAAAALAAAAPREEPELAPLPIEANDIVQAIRRVIEFLSVPRVVLITIVAVVVLVPLALWVRSDDIAKVKADRLFEHKKWSEAAPLYEGIFKNFEAVADTSSDNARRSADTNAALARCYLHMGKPGEALALIEATQKKIDDRSERWTQPAAIELRVLKGWAYFDLKKPGEAIQELSDVLQKPDQAKSKKIAALYDPKNPLANYLMGRHFLALNDLKIASGYFLQLAGLPEYVDERAEYVKAATAHALQLTPEEQAEIDKLPEQVPTTTETQKAS